MQYTIGKIYRLGLLKGRNGPYRAKAEVSRALRGLPYEERQTPHGMGKFYDIDQITKLTEVKGIQCNTPTKEVKEGNSA